MKKVVNGEFQRSVDYKTGEVTEESSFRMVKFPQEPPYVKMYVEDLCKLVGVSDSDQSLLRLLLVRLDYEGYVVVTTRVRESICRGLKIKKQTLKNRLHRLVKSNLIKPIARNEYMVNPNFFAKGDWKKICERRLAYNMNISYSEEGRSITTEVVGDEHLQQPLDLT